MPPVQTIEHGFYVDLEKAGDGNLPFRLTRTGRQHFHDIREEQARLGTHAALYALLEDHLCNGWKWCRQKTGSLGLGADPLGRNHPR